MRRKGETTGAVDFLHKRYVEGDSEREAALEKERVNAAVAKMIYDLRTDAGLSQKELAQLVGTTQSVISRLEDSDYRGHSLSMLNRIAAALSHTLTITVTAKDPDTQVLSEQRTGVVKSESHKVRGGHGIERHGPTEVKLSSGKQLDAKRGKTATEVERSGSARALGRAAQRLRKSRAPNKVLQVPQTNMSKAAKAMSKKGVRGTVKNLSGTRRRSVR